jgi:hypothetical protein
VSQKELPRWQAKEVGGPRPKTFIVYAASAKAATETFLRNGGFDLTSKDGEGQSIWVTPFEQAEDLTPSHFDGRAAQGA